MTHFIPKYAAQWKDFGLMLGLEEPELDCIGQDKKRETHWSRACMQAVFSC